MAYDYRNRSHPRFSDWNDNPDYRNERREGRGQNISGDNNYGIDNDLDYRFREQSWRPDLPAHYPAEPHPINAAFGTRMGNFGQIIYDPTYGIDSFGYHNDVRGRGEYRENVSASSRESLPDHRGKGPKNYLRSDERISEDINDRLHDDPYVDASNIEVEIDKAEVVLSGTVSDINAKRRAAYIAEEVRGVRNVENRIRVRNGDDEEYKYPTATTTGGATNTDSKAEREPRDKK